MPESAQPDRVPPAADPYAGRRFAQLAWLPRGLEREGSFGPDPMVGMLPWNVEMTVWIDEALGIEVAGMDAGKTNFSHRLAVDCEEAETFARAAGFPSHHLVVRPEHRK